MGDFRMLAMDEYLKDLAAKRHILEQKCQMRQATAAEFQALRQETVRMTQKKIESSNMRARERNVKILEEMNNYSHLSSTRALLVDSRLLNSASNLESARAAYVKTASQLLPAWRSHKSDAQLQEAAKLREQRIELEQRRQRALQDAEEEMKTTVILEEERRQFLLAVALQNRESALINSQAKSLLAESQAVDYLMKKEVEKHREQAFNRDSRILQQARERLLASMESCTVDDNDADILQSLKTYQKAMTTPEDIVEALRKAPQPPSVTIDRTDIDLAQMQPRLVIRSQSSPGEEHPKAQLVHSSSGLERGHSIYAPHQQTIEDMGPDHDSDDQERSHLLIQTRHSDDDDDKVTKQTAARSVRNVRPHSNRGKLTPKSSFEHNGSENGPILSFRSADVDQNLNAGASINGNPSGGESRVASAQHSTKVLLSDSVSTAERIDIFDKLCRRLEVLDDVSREREVIDPNQRLRRDEQYVTAIQAYRKASRAVMGFSSSSDMPPSTNQDVKNPVPDYLYDLCRAVSDGRERETALFGIEAVAEAIIHITVEIGSYLLPRDILNGVITEDKVHRNMRKLGGGRLELWRLLTLHLRGLVAGMGAKPEELSHIFTAALIMHVPRGDEEHRAERKIRTLIQLEIMPKTPDPKDSMVDSSFSISMNETKALGDISVSDNIAPPPVLSIAASEPAKKIESPRIVASQSPRQDPEVRIRALKALDDVFVDADTNESIHSSAGKTGLVALQRYNSSLSDSGFGSIIGSFSPAVQDPAHLSVGRYQVDSISQPHDIQKKKGGNIVHNEDNNNTSITSSVPQATKFSSAGLSHQSKIDPSTKKWSSVKNIISIEDDEFVSDDDAIAAPPPTRLMEEKDSDSNEFDF